MSPKTGGAQHIVVQHRAPVGLRRHQFLGRIITEVERLRLAADIADHNQYSLGLSSYSYFSVGISSRNTI